MSINVNFSIGWPPSARSMTKRSVSLPTIIPAAPVIRICIQVSVSLLSAGSKRSMRRRSGNNSIQMPAISNEPNPPISTEGSTPSQAAARRAGAGRETAIRARTSTCSGFRPARAIVAEKLVEFGVRHHPGKTVEFSLVGDLARRLDERIHADPRQRSAHADAPYAHLVKIFDREAERATVEKVDRLRRDRLHGRHALLPGPNP